ncbi:uncharacterized protein G2W53_008355 [Senna tora]|uniref:Uncharacterized protein n=1 Tax=Senna tora TaxID=362788 RepID=A0A834X6U9_9FABA|nr:uncharacterized protein G2W53_008355 [Senna tora]
MNPEMSPGLKQSKNNGVSYGLHRNYLSWSIIVKSTLEAKKKLDLLMGASRLLKTKKNMRNGSMWTLRSSLGSLIRSQMRSQTPLSTVIHRSFDVMQQDSIKLMPTPTCTCGKCNCGLKKKNLSVDKIYAKKVTDPQSKPQKAEEFRFYYCQGVVAVVPTTKLSPPACQALVAGIRTRFFFLASPLVAAVNNDMKGTRLHHLMSSGRTRRGRGRVRGGVQSETLPYIQLCSSPISQPSSSGNSNGPPQQPVVQDEELLHEVPTGPSQQ